MIDEVTNCVREAVKQVFSTMVQMDLEAVDCLRLNGEERIASSVGFAGNLTGVVYLSAAEPFARQLTGAMTGLEEEEMDDVIVNDAMGEITNMIVGNMKSQMSAKSVECSLTVPSIVRGTHLEIETLRFQNRSKLNYKNEENFLSLEVLLKEA